MLQRSLLLLANLFFVLLLQSESLKRPTPRFDNPFSGLKKVGKDVQQILTRNPIANVVQNTYSFFYWLPRRNIPFDSPWEILTNNTAEFIAWYQIPHNLPPYIYLSEGYPEDFFCWGLPGNTLPLGNWDPWFMQNTSPAIMKKYRESEIKHGRLAMLASFGFITQELYHPLYANVGGLAVTHMAQLLHLPAEQSLFYRLFALLQDQLSTFGVGVDISSPLPDIVTADVTTTFSTLLSSIPLDYLAVVLFLASFELSALKRNWTRWLPNEWHHQFVGNYGIGNLQESYENGNYAFDLLRLRPDDKVEYRDMQNKELNHGRLAMIAMAGMLVQEYLTGVPVTVALLQWLRDGGILDYNPYTLVQTILSLPDTVVRDTTTDAVKVFNTMVSSTAAAIQADTSGGENIGGIFPSTADALAGALQKVRQTATDTLTSTSSTDQ